MRKLLHTVLLVRAHWGQLVCSLTGLEIAPKCFRPVVNYFGKEKVFIVSSSPSVVDLTEYVIRVFGLSPFNS